MNKRIFAILIILICALSISAVSAADDSPVEDVAAVADTGSFADLNDAITKASGTLELGKNYTYSDTDSISTITINKDLTIDGKDHTIDASGKASVFTIDANKKVTIKNINFINGNSTTGGAITNNGNLTLINCNFINNTAATSGGAIYNTEILTVTNCVFDGNDLTKRNSNSDGGAVIFSVGDTTTNIMDSEIKNSIKNFNNTSDYPMAAICILDGNLTISECKFTNNTARYGGAVYVSNERDSTNKKNYTVIIKDSTFNDNHALYGGAIYEYGDKAGANVAMTISNCNFTGNGAIGKGDMTPNNNNGGALEISGYAQASIENCNFINNTAHYGGAIQIAENNGVTISDCSFINNSATASAGAIQLDTTYRTYSNNVTISGCSFINNSASKFGGAIWNTLDTAVDNSVFANNTAETGADIACTVSASNYPDVAITLNNITSDGKGIYIASDNVATNITDVDLATEMDLDVVADVTTIDNVTISGNVAIVGTEYPKVNGTVTITIDGIKPITTNVVNGTFTANIPNVPAGTYNATVVFTGKDYISSNATTNKFTVNKVSTTIAINPIDKIAVGDNITVSGNTTGIANNAKITITVNGKVYNTTVVDNKFSQKINNITPEGTAKVVVSYAGDDKINASTATIDVTVGKDSPVITFDNITAIIGQNVTVTGTTVPSVANITITANGKTFNVNVTDGTFSVNIGNFTKAGNQIITVEYKGNENYTAFKNSTTFTVEKKATSITIGDIAGIAGDKIVINGTVAGIPQGATITITVGTVTVTAKVNGTKFSATVDGQKAGNYTITAKYAGTDDYAPATATANLTLTQVPTSITIDDLNIFIGENAIIVGNVTGIPENATVIITVADKEYNAKVNGTKFLITVKNLALGSHNITASYEGTIKYEAASANATVTVSKYPTVTTIKDITDVLNAGDRLLVNATVTSQGKPVNGTVELLINGKSITKKEAVNGTVSFNVTPYAGKVTVMVKFVGDDKYGESNATHDITVKGTDATLTVPDITLFFKNGTQLMIYLTSNGKNVSDEKVTININGVDYTRTVKNGTAKFPINLAPGTYNATVSLLSEKYNFVSKNATVTVLPVIEGNDTVLFFKNGTKYVALFLDGHGKPLAGAKVQFNINGVFYDRTTNANGTASITINLAQGTYKITAINPANGALYANNITVLPVIEGNDTVLFFKNGTKYVALFLDGHGKPLAGAKVQFNINGVFYDRTTNANGTASITINLGPGKYVITAINTANGALHANNITVLPTIISENIVKYYKNETQYVVKVVDGKGVALANQTVNYNINGVLYKRTTDANGTAIFKINLAAGNSEPQEYIITAWSNDCIVSNTVTVLPVLTAKDFTEPFEAGKKFTAKIVDGQGKPLAGAKIQFNINGIFYNRTSNVNGTVGLNINLAPGEYIISTICNDNGAIISNKVTVTPKV